MNPTPASQFLSSLDISDPWVWITLGLSAIFLLFGLAAGILPPKLLKKPPIIAYGIFLLPLIAAVLTTVSAVENMKHGKSYSSPEMMYQIEVADSASCFDSYIMLSLYAFLPISFLFSSLRAISQTRKKGDWESALTSAFPSLLMWIIAGIGASIIYSNGLKANIAMLGGVVIALLIPFSSLRLKEEDGETIAFLSNYFGVLGTVSLYAFIWGDKWKERLLILQGEINRVTYGHPVSTSMKDGFWYASKDPFPQGQDMLIVIGGALTLGLFFYAFQLKKDKFNAVLLTIFMAGICTLGYLIVPNGEELLGRYPDYAEAFEKEPEKGLK